MIAMLFSVSGEILVLAIQNLAIFFVFVKIKKIDNFLLFQMILMKIAPNATISFFSNENFAEVM